MHTQCKAKRRSITLYSVQYVTIWYAIIEDYILFNIYLICIIKMIFYRRGHNVIVPYIKIGTEQS